MAIFFREAFKFFLSSILPSFSSPRGRCMWCIGQEEGGKRDVRITRWTYHLGPSLITWLYVQTQSFMSALLRKECSPEVLRNTSVPLWNVHTWKASHPDYRLWMDNEVYKTGGTEPQWGSVPKKWMDTLVDGGPETERAADCIRGGLGGNYEFYILLPCCDGNGRLLALSGE